MSSAPTSVSLRASWTDLNVVCTEHAPAAVETRASAGPSTLSVALLPVERAEWRLDGGSTRPRKIIAGTTSVRSSREVVWARWDQPCKCIHISLQAHLLDRVAAESGMVSRELQYREGIHDPTVLRCALILAQEAAGGGLASDLYVESIANVLAIHVLREYADANLKLENNIPPLDALRVQRVKDYIEANIHAPLSLVALAKVAASSPSHFSRSFKAATRLSPHRYLSMRRIERAKMLLAATEMPISDVALCVGIANQSHFGVRFLRLAGCTPKQFRDASRPSRR